MPEGQKDPNIGCLVLNRDSGLGQMPSHWVRGPLGNVMVPYS